LQIAQSCDEMNRNTSIDLIFDVKEPWNQHAGRFLSMIGQNPSVFKSYRLHVVIARFFFINLRHIP